MMNATATATTAQMPSTKDWFFKNILVATDFSPASDHAIEYAASLACLATAQRFTSPM